MDIGYLCKDMSTTQALAGATPDHAGEELMVAAKVEMEAGRSPIDPKTPSRAVG
jgi:hypothetical protein